MTQRAAGQADATGPSVICCVEDLLEVSISAARLEDTVFLVHLISDTGALDPCSQGVDGMVKCPFPVISMGSRYRVHSRQLVTPVVCFIQLTF